MNYDYQEIEWFWNRKMKIFTYSGRILTGKRETCKQQRLDLKFDEQGF